MPKNFGVWHMKTAFGLALAACLSATQAQASGVVCAAKSEAEALEARVVQTELMVAALSCNAAARYNAFVQKFRPELASAYKRLAPFFGRIYGGNAEKHVNDYVTRTANESSQRAIAQIDDFCRTAALSFDLMERTDHHGFASVIHAQPAAMQTGYETCPEKSKRRVANASGRLSASP